MLVRVSCKGVYFRQPSPLTSLGLETLTVWLDTLIPKVRDLNCTKKLRTLTSVSKNPSKCQICYCLLLPFGRTTDKIITITFCHSKLFEISERLSDSGTKEIPAIFLVHQKIFPTIPVQLLVCNIQNDIHCSVRTSRAKVDLYSIVFNGPAPKKC